jgi:signal transduction histidine kinase
MSAPQDSRDPRRERLRVALAFALAVAPPLGLLAWLAARSAKLDHEALLRTEEIQTQNAAQRTRDAIVQAVREAEEACFPRELGALRSRDARVRAELDRNLDELKRDHPIVKRWLAFDEDAHVLVPDARAPFRPDGSAPVGELDEDRATDPATVEKRRELRARYASVRESATPDVQLLAPVMDDPDAPQALKARAAFLAARLLDAKGDFEGAAGDYARAASSPVPVRDEKGDPIRPRAALREAELLDRRDHAEGYKRARDLANALLSGEHRDLTASEWRETFAQTTKLLDAIAASESVAADNIPEADRPTTGSRLVMAARKQLEDRLDWVRELEGDLGAPLRGALATERAGDELHHDVSLLRDPPVLVVYRVLPTLALDPDQASNVRTSRLVFGFELDLDRLTKEVLAPACAKESLEEDVSDAVVDVRHGTVAAYGGADSAPDAGGKPRPTHAIRQLISLDPLTCWQLEVRRSSDRLTRDSRARWIVFAGIFTLALVTAAGGGAATFRSVARSLELARMKQDFVSNVTHELKTPLTSIRMYAETLSLGRARNEEKKKEYLEHIVRESERLQRLIDDILDFARIGEGKKPYVLAEGDVAEVALEAIDLFRHSMKVRGFELYLDLPAIGALPPVDLDKDALVRSVLNLLSNAVKYSPDSNYVAVSVKREGDMIAVAVEDRGIGIAPEDLERIFDRFYRAGDHLTRAIPGAGLGLSLVDEIVKAHGGQIRTESEKGKGSKFTILLPIVADYRNVPWPPVSSAEESAPPEDEEPPEADVKPTPMSNEGGSA